MKIPFEIYPPLKVTVTMRKEKRETKGYRNRYDVIDHGHKKITFMYFFKDLWCIEGILYWSKSPIVTFLDNWHHKIVSSIDQGFRQQ